MSSGSTVNTNDPFADLEEEAREEEAQAEKKSSSNQVASVVADNDPFANLEEAAKEEEAALAQPLAQPLVQPLSQPLAAQEENDQFSNLEEEARAEEAVVAEEPLEEIPEEVSPATTAASPVVSPASEPTESPMALPAPEPTESPVASPAPEPLASPAPEPIAVPPKSSRPPIIRSTAEPSSPKSSRPPIIRSTAEPSSQKSTRPPVIQPTSQPSVQKSTRPPVILPAPISVNESENEDEEMDEGMNSLNSNTLRQLWNSTNDERSRQVLRQAFLNRGESPPEEEMDEEEEVIPQQFKGMVDPDLLALWDDEVDPLERDRIVKEMQRRNLFPSEFMQQWEHATGAYPDIIDPEFLQKLLAKREFAESLQKTWEPATDPCNDNSTFEVTPVQRFVTNFMSPKTPYMSALLFHGVGVGKTCAGVQIMEAWLEFFPQQPVYLIAPQTIQHGFYRTIFDIKKVVIGQDKEPNTASQCTGTTYMKLTNTLFERDPVRIEKLVMKAIRRRYKVFGYISFANYIRDLFKGIPKQ